MNFESLKTDMESSFFKRNTDLVRMGIIYWN